MSFQNVQQYAVYLRWYAVFYKSCQLFPTLVLPQYIPTHVHFNCTPAALSTQVCLAIPVMLSVVLLSLSAQLSVEEAKYKLDDSRILSSLLINFLII